MDLTRLVPAGHCVLEVDTSCYKEAIRTTMQPLVDSGIVTDAETFNNRVLKREAQITTVIGNGVAVPHARSRDVTRLGLAIGILKEPIKFNDEGDEVSLIFLISIPSFAPVAHMPLLQHLASFVRYPKKIDKLLLSKTPAAAAKYLCSYKARAKK